MKKASLILLCLLAILITGCATGKGIFRDGETEIDMKAQNYEVLGRVQMVKKLGMGIELLDLGLLRDDNPYLYYELYNTAKELYPATDEIMNITVDYEQSKFLFIRLSGKYTITGLAVDITKTN